MVQPVNLMHTTSPDDYHDYEGQWEKQCFTNVDMKV